MTIFLFIVAACTIFGSEGVVDIAEHHFGDGVVESERVLSGTDSNVCNLIIYNAGQDERVDFGPVTDGALRSLLEVDHVIVASASLVDNMWIFAHLWQDACDESISDRALYRKYKQQLYVVKSLQAVFYVRKLIRAYDRLHHLFIQDVQNKCTEGMVEKEIQAYVMKAWSKEHIKSTIKDSSWLEEEFSFRFGQESIVGTAYDILQNFPGTRLFINNIFTAYILWKQFCDLAIDKWRCYRRVGNNFVYIFLPNVFEDKDKDDFQNSYGLVDFRSNENFMAVDLWHLDIQEDYIFRRRRDHSYAGRPILDILKRMFLPKENVEEKSAGDEVYPSWNVYVSGHGTLDALTAAFYHDQDKQRKRGWGKYIPSWLRKSPAYVPDAGVQSRKQMSEWHEFLSFLKDGIHTHSLTYLTCFPAGEKLQTLFQDTNNKFVLQDFSFPIISRGALLEPIAHLQSPLLVPFGYEWSQGDFDVKLCAKEGTPVLFIHNKQMKDYFALVNEKKYKQALRVLVQTDSPSGNQLGLILYPHTHKFILLESMQSVPSDTLRLFKGRDEFVFEINQVNLVKAQLEAKLSLDAENSKLLVDESGVDQAQLIVPTGTRVLSLAVRNIDLPVYIDDRSSVTFLPLAGVSYSFNKLINMHSSLSMLFYLGAEGSSEFVRALYYFHEVELPQLISPLDGTTLGVSMSQVVMACHITDDIWRSKNNITVTGVINDKVYKGVRQDDFTYVMEELPLSVADYRDKLNVLSRKYELTL